MRRTCVPPNVAMNTKLRGAQRSPELLGARTFVYQKS